MKDIDRRSAVALGLATAAAPPFTLAAAPPAAAQTRGPAEGREIAPGVRQVDLSPPRPSKIQGFRTVSMRDVVLQPGSEIAEFAMPNPMLCHVTEGELTVRQDGREFVAKRGDAWDCGKGTREGTKNSGTAVGVMRIIDLDMSMT
jgi:quercetin dioxygenase-like cupin family protein